MKRKVWSLFMIFSIPLLLGMGSQGGAPIDKIPVPAKKFTAQFIDQMDVTTECSDISIEGNTYLEGKRGEGTFSVAFENIQQILFRQQAEKIFGQVKLRDGQNIELAVSKDKKAYGRTIFGTFQIRLGDLKKVIIAPGVPRKN
jgi:hypothetical protein